MAHRPQMGDIVQMATRVAPDSDSHFDRKPEVKLSEYLDDDKPIVVKHMREGVLGFFSGLERTAADEVERLAESIVYTDEEEKVVTRKIDFRLLPIVVLSYITNQSDHTNIAAAHVLPAFNKNFGISNNQKWILVLSVVYIGHSLLEIPSNILQRHIGANRFFFLSLTWWGLSSLSFVYTKGYTAAIILRILLGFGESGFYAGMIYYLSFWYKRKELAFRISLCMTSTIAGWMSSLLAFGLLRLHTKTLANWQILYLAEALPSLIMAAIILLFLPAFPFTAKFLTKRQRVIAVARLRDHRPKSHGGSSGWEAVRLVLKDPHTWGFVIIYSSSKLLTIFQNVCVATATYFMPTLINKLGYNPIQTQALTIGPYFMGMLFVWFQSWHSDKTKDRGYHVMGSAITSVVGYLILVIYSKNHMVCYCALHLVVAGNWSLFPLVMSWAVNTMSPTSKRGIGTAFIVSISNVISIASPQIYFDPQDSFTQAHCLSAGLMLLTFLTALALRIRFTYLNKKRDRMLSILPPNRGPVPADDVFEDFPDTDIRYRYMT